MAVTVHFERDGEPIALLLDIVEVPFSHTGVNLARAFADILEDFGISDKVSVMRNDDNNLLTHLATH